MAAFGFFPFDLSGGGRFGGDAGPAYAQGSSGRVNVGGLNAPAYPFTGIPGQGGRDGLSDWELLALGLGALALVLVVMKR